MNIKLIKAICNYKKIERDNDCLIKVSNNRGDCFQIVTKVSKKYHVVTKEPCNVKTVKHLKKMQYIKSDIRLIKTLKYVWIKDRLVTYYLNNNSLDTIMINNYKDKNLIANDNIIEKIKTLLFEKSVYKHFLPSKEFKEVFGERETSQKLHILNNANIDITPENTFIDKENYIIIDPEWFFDFEIPAEYVMWRFIRNLNYIININKINNNGEYIADNEKNRLILGIDYDTSRTFEEWENNIVINYVGQNNKMY